MESKGIFLSIKLLLYFEKNKPLLALSYDVFLRIKINSFFPIPFINCKVITKKFYSTTFFSNFIMY